jgi:hypothetical protein
METLCLLSYRGAQVPHDRGTNGPRYTLAGGLGESIRGLSSPQDHWYFHDRGNGHFRRSRTIDIVSL